MAREIRALAERFHDRPVFLDDVLQAAHGRGYDLFLVLLSLPFLTPVPLPFLSTPFGLIICLAGLRMALGHRPWWPHWFRQKQLPPRFFPRLLRATSWIVGTIEFLVKPRLQFFHQDT
ncbi:MAG TPA: exopolysaccharide biosynthesis protein, partial [Bacillota bacterium]|nr:exopolysaccharide biosynthesis protein [Bacillota bacterium]